MSGTHSSSVSTVPKSEWVCYSSLGRLKHQDEEKQSDPDQSRVGTDNNYCAGKTGEELTTAALLFTTLCMIPNPALTDMQRKPTALLSNNTVVNGKGWRRESKLLSQGTEIPSKLNQLEK